MLHTTYLSDKTILIEGNLDHLYLFARLNHLTGIQRSKIRQYRKAGQPAGWVMPTGNGKGWRGLFDVEMVQVWTLAEMIKVD